MDGIYDLMELSKEHDLPVVSEDGVRCFDEDVLTYLEMCEYDINKASAAYAVVSTVWQRYGYELSAEVSEKLDLGFSPMKR